MSMPAVRTVQDKKDRLKERQEQQRHLGQTIDKMVAEGQNVQYGRTVGCSGRGLCPRIGRGVARCLGLSKRAGAVSTSEIEAVSDRRTDGVTGQTMAVSLFGKPLGKKATAQGKLESATAAMRTRIESLDARAQQGRATAQRAMQEGNKPLALRELKRAKMIEKQSMTTQVALDAMEQQSDMLAQTALQREVAAALGATAKSLKKEKGLLSKAEDAVDAAAEMRDFHEDLSNAMASLGDSTSNEYDEDDLMLELEGMVSDDVKAVTEIGTGENKEAALIAAAKAELERKHTEYDNMQTMREGLPSVPKTSGSREVREKQALLE